ncbi:hypothetical protein K9M41_01905 [Candidatus Gracilibacteria bacterium]|nr:hypothetical protein [Candidatus Gracilibacteria bacterium]
MKWLFVPEDIFVFFFIYPLQYKKFYFLTHINMETSLFLAKFLGIMFTVMGLAILFNFKTYPKVMGDVLKNSALVYLCGFLSLMMGILLVLFHNVWEGGWVVLITVIAWISLVKGVLLLLFPGWMTKMKQTMCTSTWCGFGLVFCFVVGLFLLSKGYAITF